MATLAERDRAVLATATDDLDVVRAHRLGGGVVVVERPPCRAHAGTARTFCPGGSLRRSGTPTSMTKQPPGSRCARDVAEARDLRVLGGQVHDRVEDQVDDGERPVHPGGREVADRHADARRRPAWRAAGPPSPAERSMPWTGTPRRASGRAMRPVPMPSSRARPPPASPPEPRPPRYSRHPARTFRPTPSYPAATAPRSNRPSSTAGPYLCGHRQRHSVSAARGGATGPGPPGRRTGYRYVPDQPERLGHDEGVVVDGEFRVSRSRARMSAECQNRSCPARQSATDLYPSPSPSAWARSTSARRITRTAVVSIATTGLPEESTTICRKPG